MRKTFLRAAPFEGRRPEDEWIKSVHLRGNSFSIDWFRGRFEHGDEACLTIAQESAQIGDSRGRRRVPLHVDLRGLAPR